MISYGSGLQSSPVCWFPTCCRPDWRCDLQVVTEGTAQGNLAIVSKQLSFVKCWMWDDIAAKMKTLVLLLKG